MQVETSLSMPAAGPRPKAAPGFKKDAAEMIFTSIAAESAAQHHRSGSLGVLDSRFGPPGPGWETSQSGSRRAPEPGETLRFCRERRRLGPLSGRPRWGTDSAFPRVSRCRCSSIDSTLTPHSEQLRQAHVGSTAVFVTLNKWNPVFRSSFGGP